MTAFSSANDPQIPDSRRGNITDTYHGEVVADPYRWLEDLDGDETAAWVAAQNEATFGYLTNLPARASLQTRMEGLLDIDWQSVYGQRGDWLFFRKRSGLQDHAVYCRRRGEDGPVETLIDPNTLSEDGSVSLGGTYVSPSGRYLAYMLSESGSDWRTIYVRDLETGKDLADNVEWVKFSGVAWTKDEKGFFYSRYPTPETDSETGEVFAELENKKIHYHRLGTDPADDPLIYERPDQPKWGMGAWVTEDGKWLAIYLFEGTNPKNAILTASLGEDPLAPDIEGVTERLVAWDQPFTADISIVDTIGDRLLVATDADAPRQRVVTVDPADPARANWKELIPETEHVIQSVDVAKDRIFVATLEDVKARVRIFKPDGTPDGDLPLPGVGTLNGLSTRRESSTVFFGFTSLVMPGSVFRFDLETRERTPVFSPALDADLDQLESRQVFVESKDGTKVPMFLAYRKGTKPTGDNPVLLSGYGGFNVSVRPGFSSTRLPWLEAGGVIAIANLRGGGEYGREWHEAGRLDKKQNVFDDFIAAAEWLVENKWTRPDRLAIRGGSNGGLLVGAVINQRPDLFGAAVPAVGVMDMLRYHTFTIGHAWVNEYGSSDDPDQYKVLRAYSPLHNVRKDARYPAVMVTTGDHDDRVHPGHSFKYAAALQAAQALHGKDAPPVFIRIETKSGHGAGLALNKAIAAQADTYAFLIDQLGAPDVPVLEVP